jgi:hypothetical protein
MPNPPDELGPLQLLVLSRLLVAGEKGAGRDQVVKDLRPLLEHRWSGGELTERLDEALEALVSAGLMHRTERGQGKRKTRLFLLNDSGRNATLEALGLAALPPKTTWGQVVSRYLAARSLGLTAPSGAATKRFGGDTGFKAAVLRTCYELAVPEFPDLKQAQDALLWKLLGRETSRKFDLKSVKEFLLARALGEPEHVAEKEAVRRLVVRDLRPRNSKPAELRAAAIRRWLNASLAGPEPLPMSPSEGSVRPSEASLPLDDFARRVVAAARTIPTGRFGENKMFIAHAWRALRDDPEFRGMDLDAFKRRLAEANQARYLDLSRADLVEAMDPEDVRLSEVNYLGASFHFIRI